MSDPFVFGCLWVLVAAAITALPRRGVRWGALGLLITGIPLVGWITLVHGPIAGFLALAAAASVLRWPLYWLGRRVVRLVR